MTSQNALAETPVASAPPIRVDAGTAVIETRFGEMEFRLENAIYMPRGMLGYADFHEFGLANMPDPKLEQFKLLQSLSDHELSFIVAPLNPENDTIDPADIGAACALLSLNPDQSVVLLVVSTRRLGPNTQISVNLRAPIILDPVSRTAYQHVLLNNRYSVRHVIGTTAPATD